jgi:hypothetical protein
MGVTHLRGGFPPPRRACPLLPRSYGLRRQAKTLPPPSVVPPSVGRRRLSQGSAGHGLLSAFSPRLLPRRRGPLPRRALWGRRPLLPRGHRPAPGRERLGTPHDPYRACRPGEMPGLQSFAQGPASGFARHPGRSDRRGPFDPRGSRGVYVRAYDGLFPPRPSDMLAARIGQWTAWGLPPHQMRGLAGRSPDVISARLALAAWTFTPAACWVPFPMTSPPPSACPQAL